jgi:MOSC domain-containing protein YiiM
VHALRLQSDPAQHHGGAGEIPVQPGTRLRIDDVELEVVRVAAPCRLVDDSVDSGDAVEMNPPTP